MSLSKYISAFACAALSAVSGQVSATEPPPLPDAGEYLVRHGMNRDDARAFIRAASDSDHVKLLTGDSLGQTIMALRAAGVERGAAYADLARMIMYTQRDSGGNPYAIPVENQNIRAFLKAGYIREIFSTYTEDTLTTMTWFRCQVSNCAGVVANSTPFQMTVQGCWCSANTNFIPGEKISNITFNAINNNSSGTSGYENFTNISTTVEKGISMLFPGFSRVQTAVTR